MKKKTRNYLIYGLIIIAGIFLIINLLPQRIFNGLEPAPITNVDQYSIHFNGYTSFWIDKNDMRYSNGLCLQFDNVRIPKEFGDLYGFGECSNTYCYLTESTPLNNYNGHIKVISSEVLPTKEFPIYKISYQAGQYGSFSNRIIICANVTQDDFISDKSTRYQNNPTRVRLILDILPITATTTTTAYTTTTTIEQPVFSLMPFWTDVVSKIIDWIRGLFSMFFLVTGPADVEVGSVQTYTINITTDAPDHDYSDGTYQVQYGSWALVDRNDNVIQSGNWEEVDGSYYKQVSITVPQNPGNYVIIGVIYQYDMQYDPQEGWKVTNEGVVAKEGLSVTTKAPIPDKPSFPNLFEILQDILDWIRNFFSNIFG